MKKEDKKLIAKWLDVRDNIWRNYLRPLNAFEDFFAPTLTREVLVSDTHGNIVPLYNCKEVRDSDSARSLIVNRAYYSGAVDALLSIGLSISCRGGVHFVDGISAD